MEIEELSKQEENRIIIRRLWESGYTAKEIEELRIKDLPRTTIYNNCKKLELGVFVKSSPSGRPCSLDDIDIIEIIHYLDYVDPYASCEDIAIHLFNETNKDVSAETVRRCLHDMGYEYLTSKLLPLITPKHEDKRVEWARANKNKNWSKTLFTDETTFWISGNRITQWKPRHQEFVMMIPKNVEKLNIWAGISLQGNTSPFYFTTNLDSKLYIQILEQKLPEIKKIFSKVSAWDFQRDNDPKHTSYIAQEWMNAHRIQTLEWPSCSPDLNPIENIWGWVKSEVRREEPKSLQELKETFGAIWSHIPKFIIENTIHSMPTRCEMIQQLKGKKIPF